MELATHCEIDCGKPTKELVEKSHELLNEMQECIENYSANNIAAHEIRKDGLLKIIEKLEERTEGDSSLDQEEQLPQALKEFDDKFNFEKVSDKELWEKIQEFMVLGLENIKNPTIMREIIYRIHNIYSFLSSKEREYIRKDDPFSLRDYIELSRLLLLDMDKRVQGHIIPESDIKFQYQKELLSKIYKEIDVRTKKIFEV